MNVQSVKRWHTTMDPDFLALLYPISHRSRSVVGRRGEFDLDRRDYRNYTNWNNGESQALLGAMTNTYLEATLGRLGVPTFLDCHQFL